MVIAVVLIQEMIMVMLSRIESQRAAWRAVRLTRSQFIAIRRALRWHQRVATWIVKRRTSLKLDKSLNQHSLVTVTKEISKIIALTMCQRQSLQVSRRGELSSSRLLIEIVSMTRILNRLLSAAACVVNWNVNATQTNRSWFPSRRRGRKSKGLRLKKRAKWN